MIVIGLFLQRLEVEAPLAGCGASCRSWRRATSTRSRTPATAATSAGWRATSTRRSSASRTRPPALGHRRQGPERDPGPVGRQHLRPARRRFGVRRRRRAPAFSPPPPPSFASRAAARRASFSAPPLPSFAPPPRRASRPRSRSRGVARFGGGCAAAASEPRPAAARRDQAAPLGTVAAEFGVRRADAPGDVEPRRRRDAGRPLRCGRGRRSPLPPHLRRLHRQEARLRRVDRRPDPRQVPAEAARQQGQPGRQAQLPHRPLQRLREGRQGRPQGDADPRVARPRAACPHPNPLPHARRQRAS